MPLTLKPQNVIPSIAQREKSILQLSTTVYELFDYLSAINLPSLEGDTNAALDRRISCSPRASALHPGSRCGQTCPSAKPSAIKFSSPDRSGSYGTKTAR